MTQDRRATLSVCVVLPCYNEESSVGLCVVEALDAMRAAGIRGEVVVVDNGSTDNSAAVAKRPVPASFPKRVRDTGARCEPVSGGTQRRHRHG